MCTINLEIENNGTARAELVAMPPSEQQYMTLPTLHADIGSLRQATTTTTTAEVCRVQPLAQLPPDVQSKQCLLLIGQGGCHSAKKGMMIKWRGRTQAASRDEFGWQLSQYAR